MVFLCFCSTLAHVEISKVDMFQKLDIILYCLYLHEIRLLHNNFYIVMNKRLRSYSESPVIINIIAVLLLLLLLLSSLY